MTGWNTVTLRAKTARVRGHTAEKWDGGSWAWHEWTLGTPELKINLGPSGQPLALLLSPRRQRGLRWVPTGRG